jgi:PilZ domain
MIRKKTLSRCISMATPSSNENQPDAPPPRFVIPVRYVSEGTVVQTTSTCLSKDLIHVRCVRPPRTGLVIGLQLYFPNVRDVVRSIGLISETTPDPNSGFWAELSDDKRSADGITALLARHREMGDRGCPRIHTRLRATVRKGEGQTSDGYVTNISRSGAFVKIDSLPPAGSVIDLEFTIPVARARPETVLAYVIHVAERRGVGVQFIGGSDEFRSRLDEYVARLAG